MSQDGGNFEYGDNVDPNSRAPEPISQNIGSGHHSQNSRVNQGNSAASKFSFNAFNAKRKGQEAPRPSLNEQ